MPIQRRTQGGNNTKPLKRQIRTLQGQIDALGQPTQAPALGGPRFGNNDAGNRASNLSPEDFFLSHYGKSGMGTGTSVYDEWIRKEGYNRIYDSYIKAQAKNNLLSFKDFLQQIDPTGANLKAMADQAVSTLRAEQDPRGHFEARAFQAGLLPGNDSGSEFQDFVVGDYYGHKKRQADAAQIANPSMTFQDFLRGGPRPPKPAFATAAPPPGGFVVSTPSPQEAVEAGLKKAKKQKKKPKRR